MNVKLISQCVIWSGISLVSALSTRAQTSQIKPQFPVEDMKTYFREVLEEKSPLNSISQSLNSDHIAEAQQAVWQAWVDANKLFEEEKLITPKSIESEPQGSWTLPEVYEPNAVMRYYYGTKGSKPYGGYPLFLYLHGSGDPLSEWSVGHAIAMYNEDSPSIYFVPKIPNTGAYYRWYQKSKQWAWEKLLRQSFVNATVNHNKVYFFGVSEGGYGSQRLASFYADYLAGAGPMAGGEPLKNAPVENCRHMAFSLRTGANDDGFFRNTLTAYTRDAFEQLQKEYPDDFVHNIELIPGQGHQIDYLQTTPWLIKHERNPYPKHVMWENFEMDGRYRKGFYNIYLTSDPRGDGNFRVYYELNIEDNVINLDVKRISYKTLESKNGIDLKFKRVYGKINKGKIQIFLNSHLVDLSRPVKVYANGKLRFEGLVSADLKNIVQSCAAFYDPARLYPASVEIDMTKELTSIDAVTAETPDATQVFYDLTGKRVDDSAKGVVITEGGQKILR